MATKKKSTKRPTTKRTGEHRTCVCGYDMHPVFQAGPQDGQQHAVNCPKCGAPHGYLASAE